ncbi:MAG TPA: hypothetical protein VFI37_16285 [Gaiellaceae bacterium]|jgi:hypothetical protein|nr:hypothetical protein [Gaiellaceae bacterium]
MEKPVQQPAEDEPKQKTLKGEIPLPKRSEEAPPESPGAADS